MTAHTSTTANSNTSKTLALHAWSCPSKKRLTESEYIDDERYGADWFGRWNLGGTASTSSAQTKKRGQANGTKVEDWTDPGESSVPRGSVRNRVYDGFCAAPAAGSNHDRLGGAVDDPVGYPRDRTGGGTGNPGAIEGRCGVHQL